MKTSNNIFRTLGQAVLGFCVAVVAYIAGVFICGYFLPHDPNLRNAYLNERDQMVVAVLITSTCMAVALGIQFTTWALFIAFGFIVCLLLLLRELTQVGGHTAIPVLLAAVIISVFRVIQEHLISRKVCKPDAENPVPESQLHDEHCRHEYTDPEQ